MRVIIGAITTTLASSVSVFAGEKIIIPTLSEWGIIAMVGLFGVIGAIALRKRITTKVG